MKHPDLKIKQLDILGNHHKFKFLIKILYLKHLRYKKNIKCKYKKIKE